MMEEDRGGSLGAPRRDVLDTADIDTASTKSLAGSHLGVQESADAIVDVAIGEYDRKASREGSLFQDLHVVYKILSTTHESASGSAKKFSVWHRYRDFELLRDFLVTTHPAVVVPPVAEKKVNLSWDAMGIDRFEAAFLEERMSALEVFLERVTSHPILREDKMVFLFLREEVNFREQVMATNFQEKSDSRMKAVAASLRLKKSDKRFVDTKHYADNLETSVQAVLLNQRALMEQQRSIYKLHSVYGRILSEWSGVEADLCNELQLAGGHVDSLADATSSFLDEEDVKFSQPMKEYALYGDGIRSVVRHQLLLQYDLEQTEESLSVKALSKAHLVQEPENTVSFGKLAARLLSGDGSKESRLHMIQQEIESLELLSQQQVDRLNAFTSLAILDLKRFQHQREADIRAYWLSYAKQQIKFLRKALSTWQNVQRAFRGQS